MRVKNEVVGMEEKKIALIIKMLEKIVCATIVKRILCVIMLTFEIDKKIISEKLKLSSKSIKKYESMLHDSKIDELLIIKSNTRKSELQDYKEEILAELEVGEYKNLRQIQAMIEKKTGLKRSRQRINVFLKKTNIAL